jgi:hypothetical protein
MSKHMMSRLPTRQLHPPLRKQFKLSVPPSWLKAKSPQQKSKPKTERKPMDEPTK